MKRHVFHPHAAAEYADAVEYYRKIDPALANRFYDEMERVILAVRRNPDWFWLFDPPARRHSSPDLTRASTWTNRNASGSSL